MLTSFPSLPTPLPYKWITLLCTLYSSMNRRSGKETNAGEMNLAMNTWYWHLR